MTPPAIGPGFRLLCSLVVRLPETLVAACTKVIWEGRDGVQEAEIRRFFHAPALDFKHFSPSRSAAHDARLDSRQSRSRRRRVRHHQDPRWRRTAVRTL